MQEVKNLESKPGARNSAVELLRIVAMLLIVASHASYQCRWSPSTPGFHLNYLLLDWLALGHLGTDLFVLISGYYLCTMKFKAQRVLKLLAQVWFYSWGGIIVGVLVHYPFTFRDILQMVFPTIFTTYWFFTAYLVMLLVSPFINIFLNALTQREHLLCIAVTVTLWVIIPTFTAQPMYGPTLPNFVMLYVIAAYFRKYPHNRLADRKLQLGMLLASIALVLLSAAAFRALGTVIPVFTEHSRYFMSGTSILIIGAAVGAFALAIYSRPFTKPFINKVAACTFGVYLIHGNAAVNKLVRDDILKGYTFCSDISLIPTMLLCVAAIYAASVIEYGRQRVLEKPLLGIVQRLYDGGVSTLKTLVKRPF